MATSLILQLWFIAIIIFCTTMGFVMFNSVRLKDIDFED